MLTIELIEEKNIWDDFVDKNSYAALPHKWDFLKITEKHSSYKLHPYGFYRGDELLGVYPLFIKRIMGLKMISSPPLGIGTLYLGYLVSKEYDRLRQSKKELLLNSFLGEMETEMKRHSPDYVQVCTVPNFLDMRFFKWNNYSVRSIYTYVVDLNKPSEDIWDNLHKDLKRCIRLADSSGLEIRVSDDISMLHKRQEKRYREKAADFSLDAEYLNELIRVFPDNIKIYYVYNDKGEVISGMASQEYNKRFMAWIGVARAEEHANEFLIWKLMEQAKSEGLNKFEIAGADDRGLNMFKSRFSPSLEVCGQIYRKSILGNMAAWTYVNVYRPHFKKRKFGI